MVIYNPTDSRFLTLAQTRTNNGTKDVKLILDTLDKVFYTLDDDGNFDAVDNETAATIVELSVGTLKGDNGDAITLDATLENGTNTFSLAESGVTQITYVDGFDTGTFTISNNTFAHETSVGDMASNISSGDGGLFFRFVNNDTGSSSETTMAEDSINSEVSDGSVYAGMNLSVVGEGAQLLFQGTDYFSTMTAGDGFASLRFADENVDYRVEATAGGISIAGLPSFDDDAAASGLTQGNLYITTGDGAAPLNVAGIVMMKL
jgi:hypothetical protein